jgi:hypothetical protein
MDRGRRLCGLIPALLLTWGLAASSATAEPAPALYVAPGGHDAGPGSAEQPFKTIQRALDQAKPGDRILVKAGTYRERVVFKVSGSQEKPLILEGEPGVVVDGSTPWQPAWEKAASIAPGVWRAKVPFQPHTLTADGKYVIAVLAEKTEEKVFREGIENKEIEDKAKRFDSDFSAVGGLWMYRPKENDVILRFHGDKDVSKMEITLAPREGVVSIKGVNYCVVRGLTLKNAHYGVVMSDTRGSTVEYCSMICCDHGVWMAPGVENSAAAYCDITLNGMFALTQPKCEFPFKAFKGHGYADRRGVELRFCGNGNEVAYNYVHGMHDGIETKGQNDQDDSWDASKIQDADIHHNLIADTIDDALEPNGGEVNCRWHHNVVRGGQQVRIKAPLKGPMYMYRNVLTGIERVWCYEKSDCEFYFYHNTLKANWSIRFTDPQIPNFRFLNNVFLSDGTHILGPAKKTIVPNLPKDHIDYNFYTGDPEGKVPKSGFEAHGIFGKAETVNSEDFHLKPGCPAIDAGTDLSSKFGKPLPGCAPGYFKGKAPDMGAFEFGDDTAATVGVDPKETGSTVALKDRKYTARRK